MIKYLITHFVKNYKNTSSPLVKQSYATLCSTVGVALNVLLFIVKVIVGTISGSLSIVADGVNNITDAGSSLAAFLGFRLAAIGGGKNHPFGHGRYEWLMGFLSALIVFIVGVVLAKNSILSVFSPQEAEFSGAVLLVLVCSILVKLYMYLYTRMAQNYGDAAIAAMGIVTRMMAMGTLAVFGFMKGFQPVVGYNYGAKQYDRLWSAIKVTAKWSTIFCGVMTAILFLFPQAIISLFSNDATVLEIGANALRVNSILFVFFGIGTEYALLYLALGKSLGGLILSIGRQGLFFVPAILILPHYFELNGVILAQPIADVFTLISIIILATKINREIKGLLPVAK